MEATKPFSQQPPRRILILKFSSIGDIFQTLAAADALQLNWSTANSPLPIDWVVRSDLAALLEPSQANGLLQTVFSHSRSGGLRSLIALAHRLSLRQYTHIYDAHGSLRSRTLCILLRFFLIRKGTIRIQVLRRPKHRVWRLLSLKLGIRASKVSPLIYPWNAEQSYTQPLQSWGVRTPLKRLSTSARTTTPSSGSYGIIVPSSNWSLKNWPALRWKELLELIRDSSLPVKQWVLLGGERDSICDEIFDQARPLARGAYSLENLRGQLSLLEAMQKIEKAAIVVGVDTGWIHWANRMGLPTVAIQGPSAFGGVFGPQSINVMASNRPNCQPCSKDGSGRCRNAVYQKCLTDIRPEQVLAEILKLHQPS